MPGWASTFEKVEAYYYLFSNVSRTRVLLAIFTALAAGLPLPLMAVYYGEVIDDFGGAGTGARVQRMVACALFYFVCTWTYLTLWGIIGQEIARQLRFRYVASQLVQEVARVENRGPEVTDHLSHTISTIQVACSEKVGILIQSVSYLLFSFVVGYMKSARLTLILSPILPVFCCIFVVGGHYTANVVDRIKVFQQKLALAYEEIVRNIRIIHSLNAVGLLMRDCNEVSKQLTHESVVQNTIGAFISASIFGVIYLASALAFWQGGKIVVAQGMHGGGSVYIVLSLLIDSSLVIGLFAPFFQVFSTAATQARVLQCEISVNSIHARNAQNQTCELMEALTPSESTAHIKFENVSFAYPASPDRLALHDFSVEIPCGAFVGIVGESGSGKSTIVSLLEKFYELQSGKILFNNHDLASLCASSVRGVSALVAQEPVLFPGSIFENIAIGLVGKQPNADDYSELISPENPSTVEKVLQASRNAHAHAFISAIRTGYQTQVGSNGGIKLSVGQRQRIALARALVSNPGLLLLDEATSAVDLHSERLISKALIEQRSAYQTTIAIAHRLSTVREADFIIVMKNGRCIEVGSHASLLAQGGLYADMVNLQSSAGNGGEALENVKDAERADSLLGSVSFARRRGSGSSISSAAESDENDDAAQSDSSDSEAELFRKSFSSHDRRRSRGNRSHSYGSPTNSHLSDRQRRVRSLAKMLRVRRSRDDDQNIDAIVEPINPMETADTQRQTRRIRFRNCCSPKWRISRHMLFMMRETLPWSNRIAFGLLGSVLVGTITQMDAYLLGNLIATLSMITDPDYILDRSLLLSRAFLVVAGFAFLGHSLSASSFGFASQHLTHTMRGKYAKALLSKPIAFFDEDAHSSQAIAADINKQTSALGGLSGQFLGTVVTVLVSMFGGFLLSVIIAWRLTLVLIPAVPIIVVSGYLRLKIASKYQTRHEKAFMESSALAGEAINNIKTVASLNAQNYIHHKYENMLSAAMAEAQRFILLSNIMLSFAYTIPFLVYAMAYYWGSRLVDMGYCTQRDFFIVLPALLYSSQSSGQMFSMAPEFSQAHHAARKVFSTIQSPDDFGQAEADFAMTRKFSTEPVKSVRFNDVFFRYVGREVYVLKHTNFRLEAGKSYAFVGSSGCGKTTCLSMLERFYEPLSGSIEINGMPISAIDKSMLRSRMALVSQEAQLFHGTIMQNILLGAEFVDEARAVECCKQACIHDFIEGLPQGYNTEFGGNSTIQLSGGQKQRISLARAFYRDPEILMLDEATAALDVHTERLIEESLAQQWSHGRRRITIQIAHRLSSIKNVDEILVFAEGRVVEQGSHQKLSQMNGHYAELARLL